jgi:hypothetical protein
MDQSHLERIDQAQRLLVLHGLNKPFLLETGAFGE